VANSISGAMNGARQIECSINGIGERAGNAAFEEVVVALRTKREMGFDTGVMTEEIYGASRMVAAATGIHVQRNKAIVGENAFSHKAGIHQNGMISCANTYEIIDPKAVGRETEFVLGKHSGRHAVHEVIKGQGSEVSPEQLDEVVKMVKEMDERKKRVTVNDVIAAAKAAVGN